MVKDLTKLPGIPSMDALRKANFPVNMGVLYEEIVSPIKEPPKSLKDPQKVLLIQTTFIKGGLILTISHQHQVMDMAGGYGIMKFLSKACYGEPFTSDEIAIGNKDRMNIIPLLNDVKEPDQESNGVKEERESDHSEDDLATHGNAQDESNAAKFSWTYFKVTPTAALRLKIEATKSITTGFISTDDALAAFFWQSINRARLSRFALNSVSVACRAVDARSHLRLPLNFPGHALAFALLPLDLQTLTTETFGQIAARLRASIKPEKILHSLREMATNIVQGNLSFTSTDGSKLNSHVLLKYDTMQIQIVSM